MKFRTSNLRLCKFVFLLTVSISLVFFFQTGASASKAFPGAVGFGTQTRGAYGAVKDPVIYIVTTLSTADTGLVDSTRNGISVKSGSLRSCIRHSPPAGSGKLILFEISGTINATSSPFIYYIDHPYTTIMGQTAPSPGITLRNVTFRVRTHDVVVQHLRFRIGNEKTGTYPDYRDGFHIAGDSEKIYNVVIDRCSISWGIDETFEIWQNKGSSIYDVTVSNCIIAEGLNSTMHSKGAHSTGMVVGRETDRISLIGNLFAHNRDRNPYIQNKSTVLVNNVIYNPGWFGISLEPYQLIDIAAVGNIVIGGPNSGHSASVPRRSFMSLLGPISGGGGWPAWFNNGRGSRIFVSNNKCDAGIDKGDWTYVDDRAGYRDIVRVTRAPVWCDGLVAEQDLSAAEASVLATAGARATDRDAVDNRIINEVGSKTGKVISSPHDVGGWPILKVNTRVLSLPADPHGNSSNFGFRKIEVWLFNLSQEFAGWKDGSMSVPPAPNRLTVSQNYSVRP